MENETEAAAQVINGQVEAHVISAAEDESKLVRDAVRKLPSHAVKELLSMGVCIRCIFRLIGVSECIYSCTSLSTSALSTALEKGMCLEGDMMDNGLRIQEDSNSQHSSEEPELEPNLCRICLGILQFTYHDGKEMLMKSDCANEFALLIAKVVKQEGHQIDSFSLEVSIPSRVMENEQAVWLYMKRKYNSELWFPEQLHSEFISAKDVLKLSITNPLETLLDIKSSLSSAFRIRLTYTDSAVKIKVQKSTEMKECNKRRKTGADDMDTIGGCVAAGTDHSNSCTGEEYVGRSCNGLHNHDFPDLSQFQLEKVSEPCRLTFLCHRNPVYIGGRYLKYSRNVSQTRWIIDDERMGEASVEEIIGSNILPIFHGDNYKFHAAGREDIDVRMLGSGRPFLLEIQNARHVPSEVSIKEMERKVNNLENKLVKVKNVKVVGSQGWNLMREGEAEKQKQYAALVWISRPLEDDDLKTLSSLEDMPILQKTPIRVLHRRSPLEREKIIHWMRIERIAGSSQYCLLHLCTQAGTYVKEFVHGDLGRTHPSVGSLLGCRAEILQLDVTDVKMDCF
ncbi:TRNA pseudouridine synthase [Actinidia chinensis var. chinensis]|uniref:tRNA pseudouridine(55) synthase n=1 Tax=Actinidia chinensis var. chinensis TaxID=1590841 RepID=A0A2R6R3M5_ACTCC|nr:TRNA pseudouridine synthase [Actinidia chinensis var. chinensis]